MKLICNFHKDCKQKFCNHKHQHDISDLDCIKTAMCPSTNEIVTCVNISILRKTKILNINKNEI